MKEGNKTLQYTAGYSHPAKHTSFKPHAFELWLKGLELYEMLEHSQKVKLQRLQLMLEELMNDHIPIQGDELYLADLQSVEGR